MQVRIGDNGNSALLAADDAFRERRLTRVPPSRAVG
jgi:hypothetical protein